MEATAAPLSSTTAEPAPDAAPLPGPVEAALVDRIARCALDLPVLPQMASEVMSATSEENCDARKLAELIRRDPSLAAHLLRIANTPLFLARVPIVSLQQAIARLGIMTVRQMALMIIVQTRVFRVAGHEARVRREFHHALAAALFAQEIARLRRWNVEEAFLGGLLHDLGRPVLLQVLVDLQREFEAPAAADAVGAALDRLHARVGGQLVASWSLPPRIVEIIRHHHAPEAAPSCGVAVQLIAFADDLAHFALGELSTRAVEEEAIRAHRLLAPLNLYPDELEGILGRRAVIVDTVQAIG